jgi:two-component system, cell cycle sensor histidine kinase and response regulator CckA
MTPPELQRSVLLELGQKLGAAQTARAAAEILVEAADRLLEWDAFSFSLYSAAEDKMHHVLNVDTVGGRRVAGSAADDNAPPTALTRRVIREGGQLILKEQADQMLPESVPFGNITRSSASILFVPIRDGSNVIGVLSIQSYKSNAFAAEDLRMLQGLADYCGGALERIRAQMAERDARAILEKAQEVAHLGSWSSGLAPDALLHWSSEVYRIFGLTKTEFSGKLEDFVARIHPEDRARVKAASQAALVEGAEYELEHRIIRPDGTERCVRERAEVVRDSQGRPLRMVGVVQDITERKQLEERLRQAQKMEAIGQLAGGVAHDFNNILAATLLHLGLLRQSPQLTPGMREALKEVETQTMRAANLTRQLLLFSRRQVANVEPLDLNDLIPNLLKMLRRLLSENIEVTFQGCSEEVWVRADAGMIEQVVMNLCINARDAMPDGGRLTLATTRIDLGAPSPGGHTDARPGRFVCLTVADTGHGMDPAVLKRVFEPFFTTKEAGKGTGLGLATVYGIVKQHEGWVDVESALHRGSSFRVYLPSGTKPLDEPIRPNHAEVLTRGSETILMVEDEISVRRTAALCLRKLGYAVLEAANGVEALNLWQEHHAKIELLFTDMVMPDPMTGMDLARRLKEKKGSLKVIISSGYSADLGGRYPIDGDDIIYLPKPYQAAALAEVVRRCLDKT